MLALEYFLLDGWVTEHVRTATVELLGQCATGQLLVQDTSGAVPDVSHLAILGEGQRQKVPPAKR